LSKTGKETALYRFKGGTGGAGSRAGVIRDARGNLYGTATYGGGIGAGVVFKLDATGKESVLHRFTGGGGAYPDAGLIRDAQGNLYGTTLNGGDLSCGKQGPHGCGVVFKLTP
jgi:uncharacterized repeat protein (TIGR03803 family)